MLLESDEVLVPMTWGRWHPVILLPAAARQWPQYQRLAVLLHELAHIRRGDQTVQLLARLAAAMYWYNPLVWFALHRLCVEQEQACDDQVLDAGMRPSEYGGYLTDFARSLRGVRGMSLSAVPLARSSRLSNRIVRLLDETLDRSGMSAKLWLCTWLVLLLVLLPIASLELQPAQGQIWLEGPALRQFTFHGSVDNSSAWSPDGKWLAFTSTRSGNLDIWIKSVAGGQPRQLTRHSWNDQYPTWSPDGREVAFTSNRDGWDSMNIWAISVPGGKPRRITVREDSVVNVNSSIVSYSPDGEEIVYASWKGEHSDSGWNLWVLPASGGKARKLTSSAGRDHYPSWSPDGSKIAFCRGQVGTRDIWVVPSDGGTARRLTQHAADDLLPSWSPDGRWIAFVSKRSGNTDIWIVRADGGQPLQVTDTPEYVDLMPAWSPDGSQLTITSTPVFYSLWVGDMDGGHWYNLTTDILSNNWARTAAWSPDGKDIAYLKKGPEGIDIWKFSKGSEDPVPVTRSGNALAGLSFSPDGKRIVFVGQKDGRDHIWSVPAAGGEAIQIASTDGYHSSVSFSPDGQNLVFGANPGEIWDVFVAPVAGGELRRLVDWPTVDWGAAWSPDGEHIAFVSFRQEEADDD